MGEKKNTINWHAVTSLERQGAVLGRALLCFASFHPPSTIWNDVNKYMLEQIAKHDFWIYQRLQYNFLIISRVRRTEDGVASKV